MPELSLLGHPLSALFLFFCFYACAGWCMETVYCSVLEKRFVPRGFLHGPLCPIYGVGVLLMILFFEPLKGNLFAFYLVSTVVMSAWEYFVGWFLELTTHMKYWDYSIYRFNLKGRICLWVCLVWGVLSYVCIFWIHPPVAVLFAQIPPLTRQIVAIVLAVAVLADAIATVRELALMTKALNALQALSGELKSHYNDLVASVERTSRRLRNVYSTLRAPKLDETTRRDIQDHAKRLIQARKEALAAKRAAKRQRTG